MLHETDIDYGSETRRDTIDAKFGTWDEGSRTFRCFGFLFTGFLGIGVPPLLAPSSAFRGLQFALSERVCLRLFMEIINILRVAPEKKPTFLQR